MFATRFRDIGVLFHIFYYCCDREYCSSYLVILRALLNQSSTVLFLVLVHKRSIESNWDTFVANQQTKTASVGLTDLQYSTQIQSHETLQVICMLKSCLNAGLNVFTSMAIGMRLVAKQPLWRKLSVIGIEKGRLKLTDAAIGLSRQKLSFHRLISFSALGTLYCILMT